MNVSEYYKKDCKENMDCGCHPTENLRDSCLFAEEELITDFNTKLKILEDYGYTLPSSRRHLDLKRNEALDFIKEFPILIIRQGTDLIHATRKESILTFNEETKQFYASKKQISRYNKYFVGRGEYGGGWFSYADTYGGPDFGFLLYYKVQKDIPVLFVPNYRAHTGDTAYYPDKDAPEEFTGSHIVYGVKNWKEKGYQKIVPKYYADEFTKRLVELGFPGYISCDECEVFLTHDTMRKGLYERPYRMVYSQQMYDTCKKCGKEVNIESDICTRCEHRRKGDKNAYFKSIFNVMFQTLCEESDKSCPLIVREGARGEGIDMELVTTGDMRKMFPGEDFPRAKFIKEYRKTVSREEIEKRKTEDILRSFRK